MNKRYFFVIAFVLALGIAGFFSVPRANAQTPINTSPAGAVYLDNQWHYIPPQTTLWFLFDYSGDRTIAEIMLMDGTPKKLKFNVYSPGQISGRQDSTNPIGRGAAPQVNCETGKCLSNHVLWKSASPESGTYMIELINDNPVGMPYVLAILGSGVTLRPPQPLPIVQLVPRAYPTPVATPTLVVSPTQTVTPTIELPTPTIVPTPSISASVSVTVMATPTVLPSDVLFVLGNPPQVVPAYTQRWFGFAYPPNRAQVEISVPGGADPRVTVLLFIQEQNAANGEIKYMGEANVKQVPCATGICPSRDLAWSGELSTPGTYYVLVINNNPSPQSLEVIAIGTNR